jgi:hypothetical protein
MPDLNVAEVRLYPRDTDKLHQGKLVRPSRRLSATIWRDESPERERKLDGYLIVLSSRDGNGLCVTNIPGGVTNVAEGGSARPNGLEEEFRISAR